MSAEMMNAQQAIEILNAAADGIHLPDDQAFADIAALIGHMQTQLFRVCQDRDRAIFHSGRTPRPNRYVP